MYEQTEGNIMKTYAIQYSHIDDQEGHIVPSTIRFTLESIQFELEQAIVRGDSDTNYSIVELTPNIIRTETGLNEC